MNSRFGKVQHGQTFWLDGERCVKVRHGVARMVDYQIEIDIANAIAVSLYAPGKEPAPKLESTPDNAKKWEARWLVLGTFIESFKWWG